MDTAENPSPDCAPGAAAEAECAATGDSDLTPGFNLLSWRPIRALVCWSLFPYLFQAILLIAFVFLAVFSWRQFAPPGVKDKLFAKLNLVQLLIWGLWWPAMVWTAVLFGRLWCAVCPLELVSNFCERWGRAAGIRQAKLARWLQAGTAIFLAYAAIQLLVAGVHLHRVPAYTSIFLWTLLGVAVLTGLLIKDRAFCRGFCPVGLLLGTYGRGSMLVVRRVKGSTCAGCTTAGCVRPENRTRLDARSCPSLLNPAKLNSNSDCLVCGQCIKACEPNNMGLFLRAPFHRSDARQSLASWPVVLFVMLVSGFVVYELFSEWKTAQAVYLWVPEHVATLLQPVLSLGWIKGIWALFVVPAALWSIVGGLAVVAGGAAGLAEAWRRLALPMVVLIAAGHMAKGLAKFVSWAGFLPLAVSDPSGVSTSLAITSKSLDQPSSLLPMTVVSLVAVGLILLGTLFALREARLAQPDRYRSFYAPLLLVAALFLLLVFGWGFLS